MAATSNTELGPGDQLLRCGDEDDNEEDLIVITHFVNPQLFCYIKSPQLHKYRDLVIHVEAHLSVHCHDDNKQQEYFPDQRVIIKYLPEKLQKLVRAKILVCKSDNKYLVWAIDYGFTIACKSEEMWLLPSNLNPKYIDLEWGGISGIKAFTDTKRWSKHISGTLEGLINDAFLLKFKDKIHNSGQHSLGQLLIKTEMHEPYIDCATFLINKKCAAKVPGKGIIPDNISMAAYNMKLASKNAVTTAPNIRIHTIMRIMMVPSTVNKSNLPNFTEQNTKKPITFTGNTAENVEYIKKTFDNAYHRVGNIARNLTCPSVQLERLDKLLESHKPPQVPESAKRLSEVIDPKAESIYTALDSYMIECRKTPQLTLREQLLLDAKKQQEALKQQKEQSTKVEKATVADATVVPEMSLSERFTGKPMPTSLNKKKLDNVMKMYKDNPNKTEALRYSDFYKDNGEAMSEPGGNSITPIRLERKPKETGALKYSDFHEEEIPVEEILFAHCNLNVVLLNKSMGRLWRAQKPHLNSHFERPFPTQRYAWPHVFKNNSLILIDGGCSGRSMCYLPILCAKIQSEMSAPPSDEQKLGPLGLLITDSRENAKALTKLCVNLMGVQFRNAEMVVNTHEHSVDKNHLILLNSCGLLVSTMDHLREVLGVPMKLIHPDRLKYCVFDDFDRMLVYRPKLTENLLELLQRFEISQLQFVLVAQKWHRSDAFMQLIKRHAVNPLLLFGNYLEAATYGNLEMDITMQHADVKLKNLMDYLAKQTAKNRRTLIYCISHGELVEVRNALTEAKYIMPDKPDNQQTYQLMLLMDATRLNQMTFEFVIYYSLPHTWKSFAFGYRAFADSICNRFASANQRPQSDQRIACLVMLEESNRFQLKRLVQFLDAHNMAVDVSIRQAAETYRLVSDKNRQFCPNIVRNGACVETYCIKRHFMTEEDYRQPTVWQPGTVLRCKLINVCSPVHLSVVVTSYKLCGTTNWVDGTRTADVSLRGVSLDLHMGIEENRCIQNTLVLHDICVIRRRSNYYRVRIVDNSDRNMILVQLIDTGTYLIRVRPSEIFVCDPKYKAEAPTAFDVRLCGLVPSQEDVAWHPEALQFVKDELGSIKDNQHLQLVVAFDVFNNIYVKDIDVVQECPTMQTCVIRTQLAIELVQEEYACHAPLNTDKLRQFYGLKLAKQSELIGNDAKAAAAKAAKAAAKAAEVAAAAAAPVETPTPSRTQRLFEVLKRFIFGRPTPAPSTSIEVTENVPKENQSPVEIEEAACEDSDEILLNMLLNQASKDNLLMPAKKDHEPNTPMQGPNPDTMNDAFLNATILDNSTRPNVKWSQTMTHIDLIFEQKIPQYQILHRENVLIYSVKQTTPPQRCIFNFLGPVSIVSQTQVGYELRVKLLKKAGFIMFWPLLLSSLETQKSSHWLVYNPDRDSGEAAQMEKQRERLLRIEETVELRLKERSMDEDSTFDSEDDSQSLD